MNQKRSMDIVRITSQTSLLFQFLTGVLTSSIVFVPTDRDFEGIDDVYTIILIETASQVIEFLYYSVAVLCFKTNLPTWTRYFDWYLSTPVMLLSSAMFFVHRQGGDIWQVLDPNSARFPIVVALNALMLSFGFAMERGALNKPLALALGSLSFIGSYGFLTLYVKYSDPLSVVVFYSNFVIWFLYGVAAAFSYTYRNVSYNLLDIVSKNFYGVFLYVYVLVSSADTGM